MTVSLYAQGQTPERVERTPVAPAAQTDQKIRLFVQMDELSVSEAVAQSVSQAGPPSAARWQAAAQMQKLQAARVSTQQDGLRNSLHALGASVLSSQRAAINGVTVRVHQSAIASIRQLPGVRAVIPVRTVTVDNAYSVPSIGAPAVWNVSGHGEGIRIGIIDTGIDYTHAAFGGSGDPADYDSNDPSIVEPGSFPVPGGAVKGGIDLAGAGSDDPDLPPTRDADPLDRRGHGTHIAGTAAGRAVPGVLAPGVAPGADLYAIKVFEDGKLAGPDDIVAAGIEWAMDPNGDGDLSDHLDVINLSLGTPFAGAANITAIAAENAVSIGMIVVASAGNNGTQPYVLGAPGSAASVISVASSHPPDKPVRTRFEVTAPAEVAGDYEVFEDLNVHISEVGSFSAPLLYVGSLCGWRDHSARIRGAIIMTYVSLDACGSVEAFIQAHLDIESAGARAIVIVSDPAQVPSAGVRASAIAADRQPNLGDLRIPSWSLFADVTRLAAASNVQVTVHAERDLPAEKTLVSNSSSGPASGNSTFKPDLTAPGQAILSASRGFGTRVVVSSGTSMAAPHVTGAAALLRQRYPALEPAAIKALLLNSTVALEGGNTALTRQGVGLLRVDRASALQSYAQPGGVSFGRIDSPAIEVRSRRITVKSLDGAIHTYTGRHVANRTLPGVRVSCPSKVTADAGKGASVPITLQFDPRIAGSQGSSDPWYHSQTEVDGWCILTDGTDELRVGYIAVVDPSSLLTLSSMGGAHKTVLVRNTGPAVGFAEGFTLAKLDGERSQGTSTSIAAMGFRRGDPARYQNRQVIELAIVTDAPFNTVQDVGVFLDIDVDHDGIADVRLANSAPNAQTMPRAPGARPVHTYQSRLRGDTGRLLDWSQVDTWDYNDRVFILPFTLVASGGYVPERFDYTLHVFNGDTFAGSIEDVQRGRVDLSAQALPDINSFSVDPGDEIAVRLSASRHRMLWLFPNNAPAAQMRVSD